MLRKAHSGAGSAYCQSNSGIVKQNKGKQKHLHFRFTFMMITNEQKC